MTFLSPIGFLALLSIPALLWIWRFTASQHRMTLPSLVPFEHLLRRSPTRRTRVLINALFWLQLAALAALAFALAEPAWWTPSRQTVLAVLDTSASMAARRGGSTALQRAADALVDRMRNAPSGTRFVVVQTAPLDVLTPEPALSSVALAERIRSLRAADMAGGLSGAVRIGQALTRTQPSAVWVFTDEPKPDDLPPSVTFVSEFDNLPNAAIVGLDAQEPLCTPRQTAVIVSIQNFSDKAQETRVRALRDGRQLAAAEARLAAGERRGVELELPEDASGLIELRLEASANALEADDRALVRLSGGQRLPVAVRSHRPGFTATVGSWLEACPRIASDAADAHAASSDAIPPEASTTVLVTDDPQLAGRWPGSALLFAQSSATRVISAHWLFDEAHPISEYLKPLERIALPIVPEAADALWGDPILWAIVGGKKLPLVQARDESSRRVVMMALDPADRTASVPAVLLVLNSLRWISGASGFALTGESLQLGPLPPGTAWLEKPGGATEPIRHEGGVVRVESTDRAGRYRLTQDSASFEAAVNFLDPGESNTMTRSSTWMNQVSRTGFQGDTLQQQHVPLEPGTLRKPPRVHRPLSDALLWFSLLLVLLEWIWYVQRARRRGKPA